MKNLSKILFLLMVWLGTLVVISANSWLGLWMGLEINLLAFIPIMVNKNNLNNSEAALNYFLVQAFASAILMFSMIFLIIMNNTTYMLYIIDMFNMPIKLIMCALMLKLGAPPFHFWFPNVMENMNWMNGFMLMTWQKLAPMMILSYLMKMNLLFMLFILLSTLIGAIGGLNQTSLRKLLAFSSINHLGWMFVGLLYNENIWMMYFIIYSFMNFCIIYLFKIFQIFYLNQMYSIFMNSSFLKFSMLISMLSLGGLPPFLGFAPKWIIIQSMMYMNFNLISLFMICMSLITLFYYLKISFAAFMFNYNEYNFMYKNFFNNNNYMFMLKFNYLSLFGFFIVVDLMYLI